MVESIGWNGQMFARPRTMPTAGLTAIACVRGEFMFNLACLRSIRLLGPF